MLENKFVSVNLPEGKEL